MVLVPQELWDKETNYTGQNLRQINQNISNACVGIKSIYNRGWVRSAGNGNAKLAVQRLLAVLAEVQEIYGTKFTERNTLGVYVKIEMIGGSLLTTGVSLAKLGKIITIGCNLTIFDLFVAPVYDGNNKWQATSKSLFSSAIKKHTEKDSTAIQHYAFLTGSDEIGNLGVAFFGSMCFKFLNGK